MACSAIVAAKVPSSSRLRCSTLPATTYVESSQRLRNHLTQAVGLLRLDDPAWVTQGVASESLRISIGRDAHELQLPGLLGRIIHDTMYLSIQRVYERVVCATVIIRSGNVRRIRRRPRTKTLSPSRALDTISCPQCSLAQSRSTLSNLPRAMTRWAA